MTPLPSLNFSSGDFVADRRLELARAYAADGDVTAAAELCEQALELAPDWAAGWFALGTFREAAAALASGAVEAYRQALRLDPRDRCGATLRLARLGAIPAPAAPPPAHVRDLFDGYAERFETSLVTGLGYRAPQSIATLIDRVAPERRFALALDLGCGTGLMAPALRGRAARLEGIDLSPAMVAKARALGLYDHLEVGEIVEAMNARPAGEVDLVTAADVFCYIGDLAPVFAAVARIAAAGALVAVTTEAVAEDEAVGDVVLRDSLRWAHRSGHLVAAAAAAGLGLVAMESGALRRDRGAEIIGQTAVFTKS